MGDCRLQCLNNNRKAAKIKTNEPMVEYRTNIDKDSQSSDSPTSSDDVSSSSSAEFHGQARRRNKREPNWFVSYFQPPPELTARFGMAGSDGGETLR